MQGDSVTQFPQLLVEVIDLPGSRKNLLAQRGNSAVLLGDPASKLNFLSTTVVELCVWDGG